MEVIPLDAGLIKGSHGRVTDSDDEGPLFITTEPKLLDSELIGATEVFNRIMDHVFCD